MNKVYFIIESQLETDWNRRLRTYKKFNIRVCKCLLMYLNCLLYFKKATQEKGGKFNPYRLTDHRTWDIFLYTESETVFYRF